MKFFLRTKIHLFINLAYVLLLIYNQNRISSRL